MASRQMLFIPSMAVCYISLGVAVTLLGISAVGSVLAEDAASNFRTTVQNGFSSNNASVHHWRRFGIISGTSNNFRGHRSQTSVTNTVSRNAIGVGADPHGPSNGVDASGRDLAATPGYAPVSNSVGAAARNEPGISRPDVVGRISSPASKTSFPTITNLNHSAINGTGVSRLSSGSVVVGGPAKNLAGAISGSNFRPRHP